MKSFLPLVILAIVFSSCTAAYQSGQTPDDVYFSPERPQNEYVQMESKNNKYRYEESDDDRYLRMKVRNRRMWSDLDYYYSDPIAYDYYYNRYHNVYLGSPWNYYNSWNYYYNPYSHFNSYSYYSPYGNKGYYGSPVIIVNPKTPNYNRPRQYNLNVYNHPAPAGTSPRINTSGSSRRVFSNSNRQPSYGTPTRSTGSSMREAFGRNASNDAAPTRTQSSTNNNNSSSTNSSSNSSGRSGNAGVRKF